MKKGGLKAIIAGVSVIALALTGCGAKESIADKVESESVSTVATTNDSTNTVVQSETEAKNYGTLKVSYPTGNIRVAINILALEKGYFEEEGVKVEAVNIGGNDALTAINGDGEELDILTAGFVADVQAIGSGYDLCFFGGTAVEGGAIIAKKGNAQKYRDADTIISTEAVSNAKLGFVRNEASWIVTRQYLLDNGIEEDVIAGIEAEGTGSISYYGEATETAQAVQKGEIEIGFLPMEFALLYADAYDLEIVAAAGDLSPNYVCCREVTSQNRYIEKTDAFVAYETARIRAFQYYKAGETDEEIKTDVVKIVSAYSGKEASYVETYLYGGVTKYSVDPNTAGIEKYVLAAYGSGVFTGSAVDFGTYDIKQNIDTNAYLTALQNLIAANPDEAFYQTLYDEYQKAN